MVNKLYIVVLINFSENPILIGTYLVIDKVCSRSQVALAVFFSSYFSLDGHSRKDDDGQNRSRHHGSGSSRSFSRSTEAEESARKRRERDWEAETPMSSSIDRGNTSASRYIETPRHLLPNDTPSTSRSSRPKTPWEREGTKRFRYDYTPLATPSYMQNPWMKNEDNRHDRRTVAPTPAASESRTPFIPVDEKELEAEAEKLDRNWYLMDDGYDMDNNPFIGELYSFK
ncbi:unnamed protein product [Rodentolepis nana]|uniref:Btz domain-containing protein n=1 Tax=Rodentolepis nana TaxID=102285 RepID=A0A0R3TIC4_RODNA|nr:unnamed protein product [Rodentolepis nana]